MIRVCSERNLAKKGALVYCIQYLKLCLLYYANEGLSQQTFTLGNLQQTKLIKQKKNV